MKKHITIIVFIIVLGGFFILNLVVETPSVLVSERRPPTPFPEFSADTFADASFMSEFEEWAQDGFAFRETLRTVRAVTVFNIFLKTDKEGLYVGESGFGKFEKISESDWRQSAARIRKLAESLPESANVYYSFIPDKSIYAGKWLPGFDADAAKRILNEELSQDMEAIDLVDALTAGSFYFTDLHWDQVKSSESVMAAFGESMDFVPADMSNISNAGTFKGVYAGQLALPMAPDDLTYITTPSIERAVASYLDPRTVSMISGEVYYPEALTDGGDPYDFFLDGPQPLIVLEDPEAETERELYLFRDSFGSGVAPLFLGPYSRVTIIDIRYIDSRLLPEFVEFADGADVLFLYSSQILNNPTSLLVN